MKILGIESSCDETSAAVISSSENKITLLSNVVTTSLPLHAATGGIIPEVAAREQIKYILPVIDQALQNANIKNNSIPDIDAIAVTVGPGLIGSLLVGVETARTLSYIWKKPLIPVNHLFGHIYANWIYSDLIGTDTRDPQLTTDYYFPAIALVVSGGHTDLALMKSHENILWLGGTRDDAAGEALDKIGRLLGISYPAGSAIEKLALLGNPKAYSFPRPMIGSDDFDFSFSGLKTAVLRLVRSINNITEQDKENICAATQTAIIDVLTAKTIKAAEKYQAKSIVLGGGVAANQTLKTNLSQKAQELNVAIFIPPKNLCTDNAAMIAAAGFFKNQKIPWQEIVPNPELYFD